MPNQNMNQSGLSLDLSTVARHPCDPLGVEYTHKTTGESQPASEQVAEANTRERLPEYKEINRENIAIYACLQASINGPSSRFYSLLSFIRRTACQLGLIEKEDQQTDMVVDIAKRAITCLLLESFVYPSREIYIVHAYLRWICWRLLLIKAKIPGKSGASYSSLEEELKKSDEISPVIWRIFNAIGYLQSHSLYYEIFWMRMAERLSWPQISRLLRLRGVKVEDNGEERDIDADSSRLYNQQAFKILRQYWHHPDTPNEKLDSKGADELEIALKDTLPQAQAYLDLASPKRLDDVSGNFVNYNRRQDIEQFLITAMYSPKINVFIDEVDHSLGHTFFGCGQSYLDWQTQTANALLEENRLLLYANLKLQQLQRRLKLSSLTRDGINDVLMNCVANEAEGIELPRSYFLDRENTVDVAVALKDIPTGGSSHFPMPDWATDVPSLLEHKVANKSLMRAKKIGDQLRRAKATIGHGGWSQWLADTYQSEKMSVRTAREYMHIAKNWDVVELEVKRNPNLNYKEALAAITDWKSDQGKKTQQFSCSLPVSKNENR
jgi:hypothetical protein